MRAKTMAITAAALLALTAQSVFAADSVGYNRVNVPANTDVRLTVPFNQTSVGSFTINSVTGTGVTVSGSPFTAGALANSNYVRITSGSGAGLWSTISANGTGNLDLEDEDVLPFLLAGNTFRVYPHHTLGSVFPASLLGVNHVNGTQVLIYENNIDAMQQNKSAAKSATFTTAGGGVWFGAGVTNSTILRPETQLILRNNAASPLTMITMGEVPDYSVSTLIAANGDLVIGSGYPLPVVLKEAGLNGNNRQVLFYNNQAAGQNKSASKTATFTTAGGGLWFGAGITGNELITPSEMITFRLPAAEAGNKIKWNKPY